MTLDELEAIRTRLHNAKKGAKDYSLPTIEDVKEGYFECPLCADCPVCETEGGLPGKSWVYNNMAAGIQVFGIGEDLENLDEFAKHAPADIEALLEEVDDLKTRKKRLCKKLRQQHKIMIELQADLTKLQRFLGFFRGFRVKRYQFESQKVPPATVGIDPITGDYMAMGKSD